MPSYTLPGGTIKFESEKTNGRYPAVAASGGGGSEITVTGSGFGPAPNVVLLRTLREGTSGNTIQQSAPSGEVGFLSQTGGNPLAEYVEWNGETVYRGHDDAADEFKMQFIAPQKFKRFRYHTAIAVPDEGWMPGSSGTGFRTFPSDFGWKAIWFMDTFGGDATGIGEPDLACPTQGISQDFRISGNSINPDISFSSNGVKWDWDRFVGYHFVHDCDLTNPTTSAPATPLTSLVTYSGGTPSVTGTGPAFENSSDSSVTDENAEYDRFKIQPLARNAGGNAQAYFRDFYLAIESSPDAGDWRQALFLGDAATFSNCTVLRPKLHNSWTDTEVRFDPDYGLAYYHIIKPDGTVVSGSVS